MCNTGAAAATANPTAINTGLASMGNRTVRENREINDDDGLVLSIHKPPDCRQRALQIEPTSRP